MEHEVVRVYGEANGFEIIFSRIEGDVWQASVPAASDGTYICALYAENEVGNTAFICRMLFAITGHQIKMIMLPSGYRMKIGDARGYAGKVIERGYRCERISCLRHQG